MRPYKKVTIIILGIALFVAGSVFLIFLKRESKLNQADMPVSVDHLLTTYSNSLNSGTINDPSAFSDEMLSLVAERRSFYAEYFEKGLYLELEELESQFVTDQMTVSDDGDAIHVDVMEFVTMRGHPLIQKAEEYPLVAAADWAIAATDDENVREALRQYRSSIIDDVNDSILNGVEMNYQVQHTIEIANKNGRLQIVRDEFTRDGYDHVVWVNGSSQRPNKIDFSASIEYSIYNTPIEVWGQTLLEDFIRNYAGGSPDGTATPAPTVTPAPFVIPAFTPPADWQEYSSEYTYASHFSPDGRTGFLKYSLHYPAGWFLYPGSTISEPGLEGQTYIMNFERVGTDMGYQPQSVGTVKLAFYAIPCRGTQEGCRTDLPEISPGVYILREVKYSPILESNENLDYDLGLSDWTIWSAGLYARGFIFGLSGYMPGKPEDNTTLIESLDQILSTVKILDGGITMPTGTPLPTP